MYSAFDLGEIDVEACDAHLIPKALEASGWTVKSDKAFDNTFGTLNDSVLVTYIRNLTEPEKDISIEFVDNATKEVLNSSPVKAKTRYESNSPVDARKGQLRHISKSDFPADLKAHVNLGVGSLVMIKPYAPTAEEKCRIGLSMLHSAYLTMFAHFGKSYVENENANIIRKVLKGSIESNLSLEAAAMGGLQFGVTGVIQSSFGVPNTQRLVSDALAANPHPVFVWDWGAFSCFCVALPYHPKLFGLCYLPGFGSFGKQSYEQFTTAMSSSIQLPVHGTKVFVWQKTSGKSVMDFWLSVVGDRAFETPGG